MGLYYQNKCSLSRIKLQVSQSNNSSKVDEFTIQGQIFQLIIVSTFIAFLRHRVWELHLVF